MNKRLDKRHKRQVSRARARVRQSEPDLRTPEQIQAAREASRSVTVQRNNPHALYSTPSSQTQTSSEADETGKPDETE